MMPLTSARMLSKKSSSQANMHTNKTNEKNNQAIYLFIFQLSQVYLVTICQMRSDQIENLTLSFNVKAYSQQFCGNGIILNLCQIHVTSFLSCTIHQVTLPPGHSALLEPTLIPSCPLCLSMCKKLMGAALACTTESLINFQIVEGSVDVGDFDAETQPSTGQSAE